MYNLKIRVKAQKKANLAIARFYVYSLLNKLSKTEKKVCIWPVFVQLSVFSIKK